MGLFTGASVALAGGFALWFGMLCGALGALSGTFGGYWARVGLVQKLRVPDATIAIPEDIIAVSVGLLLAFTLK
jgi:uncharacterized membrane protein